MALSAFPMNVMAEENGDKVNLSVMCAYASEDPHGQYVYQYADKFGFSNSGCNILNWQLVQMNYFFFTRPECWDSELDDENAKNA